MHARILPGRGSGARRRTSVIGSALPSRARRSSDGLRRSKPSMTPIIVAVGVAPAGTASAMLTTPRSVTRPGSRSGFPAIWNVTSFTLSSLYDAGTISLPDLSEGRILPALSELSSRAMTYPARTGVGGLLRAVTAVGLLLGALTIALAMSRGRAHAAEESQTREADSEADLPSAPVVIDGAVLFRVRGTSVFPADKRAAAIASRIRGRAADGP